MCITLLKQESLHFYSDLVLKKKLLLFSSRIKKFSKPNVKKWSVDISYFLSLKKVNAWINRNSILTKLCMTNRMEILFEWMSYLLYWCMSVNVLQLK
jgi:hypothetical protein